MECCPRRSPTSPSSLLPGGTRRSSGVRALLIRRSFRSATAWISGGNRRLRRPAHIVPVIGSRKLTIIRQHNAERYALEIVHVSFRPLVAPCCPNSQKRRQRDAAAL